MRRLSSFFRALPFLLVMLGGCVHTSPSSSPPSRNSPPPLPADAREVDVEKKLMERPIAYIEDLLIGEPGVIVRGREVRIRGSQSGPLWVIDGVYTDTALGINPRDVDRMWIVPSGNGYGRRGANGVIIVTSKMQ